MSEYLSKKAVLEWLNGQALPYAKFGHDRANSYWHVMKEIQSGAFDANGEVQRLRAIEQAIRDFQPTKEQQAGYDALVVWLESTTTFVLDPNVLIDKLKEKEDQT